MEGGREREESQGAGWWGGVVRMGGLEWCNESDLLLRGGFDSFCEC